VTVRPVREPRLIDDPKVDLDFISQVVNYLAPDSNDERQVWLEIDRSWNDGKKALAIYLTKGDEGSAGDLFITLRVAGDSIAHPYGCFFGHWANGQITGVTTLLLNRCWVSVSAFVDALDDYLDLPETSPI
jgi:hypothetical protein